MNQETTTHNGKKHQSIKTGPEMTEMMELVDKSMLSRNVEDIYDSNQTSWDEEYTEWHLQQIRHCRRQD